MTRIDPIASLRVICSEIETERAVAYSERNELIAAACAIARHAGRLVGITSQSGIEYLDENWQTVVFIDAPTGQISWSIHSADVYIFSGLPPYEGKWDGHGFDEKYRRLANWMKSLRMCPVALPPSENREGPKDKIDVLYQAVDARVAALEQEVTALRAKLAVFEGVAPPPSTSETEQLKALLTAARTADPADKYLVLPRDTLCPDAAAPLGKIGREAWAKFGMELERLQPQAGDPAQWTTNENGYIGKRPFGTVVYPPSEAAKELVVLLLSRASDLVELFRALGLVMS